MLVQCGYARERQGRLYQCGWCEPEDDGDTAKANVRAAQCCAIVKKA